MTTRFVVLPAYCHTSHAGLVTVVLADLNVGATGDTLEDAIAATKGKLREVAKTNFEAGRDVPWKTRAPCPGGWDQIMVHARLGPKPVVRWHHRALWRLLYAGGWLLVHGFLTIERFAEWVESKRRK